MVGGGAGRERRAGVGCCLLTGSGCAEGDGDEGDAEAGIDAGVVPVQFQEWERVLLRVC